MCIICQLPTSHEAERLIIASYVDPGSGYVVQSIVPFIVGILTSVFAALMFFFRRFFHFLRNKKVLFVITICIVLGIIGFGMFSLSSQTSEAKKRVVVLGFDGMDPKLLEEGIKKGELPNFKKLAKQGVFSPLATTLPPQSPVAWASFITGTNPQKHTVYDFIARDPKTYGLHLTFDNKEQIKTKPFWEYTTEKNIPITVLFLPDTFPAETVNGKLITGMGTPDITGTEGTARLITSKSYEGKTMQTKLLVISNEEDVTIDFPGPRVKRLSEIKPVTVPIRLQRDEGKNTITATIDGKKYVIKQGAFSQWIPITFSIDFFIKHKGMIMLYIKEVAPDIEVYVSPIVMDPEDPVKQISYPASYSKDLAKKYGAYSTLGLPFDTFMLDDGIVDDKTFLSYVDRITKEREKIYFGELKEFKNGLFVGYFGFTDTISHMFWRYQDDGNPSNDVIAVSYKRADAILGKTMRMLSKNDTLIVVSDHGFAAYDYQMNLNTWLKDNGYLTLKDGKETGGALLEDIDWVNTKAYSAGYNGIYLNIKGREGKGIVNPKNAKKLAAEIKEKLLTVTNPLAGDGKAIKRIYLRDELGIAPTDTNAPDIFVGFYKGTRPAFDAAIGTVGKDVFTLRTTKWSGDHFFDPSEVPGIFLSNRKIQVKTLKIIDIMPTMLSEFGLLEKLKVDGQSYLRKSK